LIATVLSYSRRENWYGERLRSILYAAVLFINNYKRSENMKISKYNFQSILLGTLHRYE